MLFQVIYELFFFFFMYFEVAKTIRHFFLTAKENKTKCIADGTDNVYGSYVIYFEVGLRIKR